MLSNKGFFAQATKEDKRCFSRSMVTYVCFLVGVATIMGTVAFNSFPYTSTGARAGFIVGGVFCVAAFCCCIKFTYDCQDKRPSVQEQDELTRIEAVNAEESLPSNVEEALPSLELVMGVGMSG